MFYCNRGVDVQNRLYQRRILRSDSLISMCRYVSTQPIRLILTNFTYFSNLLMILCSGGVGSWRRVNYDWAWRHAAKKADSSGVDPADLGTVRLSPVAGVAPCPLHKVISPLCRSGIPTAAALFCVAFQEAKVLVCGTSWLDEI